MKTIKFSSSKFLLPHITYYLWWKTFAVSHLYLNSQKTFTVTSFYKLSIVFTYMNLTKKLLLLQNNLQKNIKVFTMTKSNIWYNLWYILYYGYSVFCGCSYLRVLCLPNLLDLPSLLYALSFLYICCHANPYLFCVY